MKIFINILTVTGALFWIGIIFDAAWALIIKIQMTKEDKSNVQR